jgi:hypothetical protein
MGDPTTVAANSGNEWRVVTEGDKTWWRRALKVMHGNVEDQSKQIRNILRYANNAPAYLQAVTDLNKESQNLLDSQHRLKIQSGRHLSLVDVYGSAAKLPNLEAALLRCKRQREIDLKVQAAMIPQQYDGDLMFATGMGAPQPFDIDSTVEWACLMAYA